MSISFNTYNSIIYNQLKDFISSNEDIVRQLLNSGIRNNAANICDYFSSLVNGFKKFNIITEPENINEWMRYANMVHDDNLPFDLIGIPPFINKTQEFYYLLIQNVLKASFYDLRQTFESKPNELDRQYLIYQTLKPIEPLLKDIAKKQTLSFNEEPIYNVLKISLFNLYFETVRYYRDFIQSEILSPDEFLYIIDNDYLINRKVDNRLAWYINEYLKKTVNIPVTQIKEKVEKTVTEFNPFESDFREGYNGKFNYDSIDKQVLFRKVEVSLYENEFIDEKYNFTNKHDKKKELAAIYRILIDKGFFKKRNYKHNTRNFQSYEYRQYLDHRYNVDTSQQFSRTKSKEIQAAM